MKKTYSFAGQQVPGEEVEFEAEIDRFNVYLLADGTKVKVKSAVLKIVRLDAWTADGDPVYLVNTQPMVVFRCPRFAQAETTMNCTDSDSLVSPSQGANSEIQRGELNELPSMPRLS